MVLDVVDAVATQSHTFAFTIARQSVPGAHTRYEFVRPPHCCSWQSVPSSVPWMYDHASAFVPERTFYAVPVPQFAFAYSRTLAFSVWPSVLNTRTDRFCGTDTSPMVIVPASSTSIGKHDE